MADTQTQSIAEKSFAGLARRITAWTTNLLATAIIFALGLAIGVQVLAWWREPLRHVAITNAEDDISGVLPFPQEGREFWTQRGSLKIERITGNETDAIEAMRTHCRSLAANKDTTALPAIGPSEQRLLNQLSGQTCLEESGDLAIHQPPNQSHMIAALSRAQQRIVGWSFALPAGQRAWSVYHFQPPDGKAPFALSHLTPVGTAP